MDGRGRVFNNIFTERLWRSVKYEEVYLKDYDSCMDAKVSIDDYFSFYNNERLHSAQGTAHQQRYILIKIVLFLI